MGSSRRRWFWLTPTYSQEENQELMARSVAKFVEVQVKDPEVRGVWWWGGA